MTIWSKLRSGRRLMVWSWQSKARLCAFANCTKAVTCQTLQGTAYAAMHSCLVGCMSRCKLECNILAMRRAAKIYKSCWTSPSPPAGRLLPPAGRWFTLRTQHFMNAMGEAPWDLRPTSTSTGSPCLCKPRTPQQVRCWGSWAWTQKAADHS